MAVYTCLVIFLRKNILRAIEISKQAARVIAHRPWLPMFPVLQAVGLLCFMLPWIYFGSYLASSGEMETYRVGTSPIVYRRFTYASNVRKALLYWLFIYYWTSQFISAVGQLTIATTVANWYFDAKKTVDKRGAEVCEAIRISLFYHAGTAAFGALVIAIIKTIRTMLMYVQQKFKDSKKSKPLKMAMCALQCCMWCLEKGMKFVTKNAYIQTAISSKAFCPAAKESFIMLLTHAGDILSVNVISSIVELLIKLCVSCVTALVAYLFFAGQTDLHGPFFSTFLVWILAYAVAILFADVFDMSISTILFAMIKDEAEFNGQYADVQLQRWMKHSVPTSQKKKDAPLKEAELEQAMGVDPADC